MKKQFLIGFFLLSCVWASGQNVIVQTQTNNGVSQTRDEGFSINGISSREDIGGVEVTTRYCQQGNYYLVFENYNNVDVTVLYQVNDASKGNVTGTAVLKAGEKKTLPVLYYKPSDFKVIVRRMGGMAQSSSPSTASSGTPSEPRLLAGYLYVAPDQFKSVTYDAAIELLNKMNTYQYCGYSDWRLPSASDMGVIRTFGVKTGENVVWGAEDSPSQYSGTGYSYDLILVRYK